MSTLPALDFYANTIMKPIPKTLKSGYPAATTRRITSIGRTVNLRRNREPKSSTSMKSPNPISKSKSLLGKPSGSSKPISTKFSCTPIQSNAKNSPPKIASTNGTLQKGMNSNPITLNPKRKNPTRRMPLSSPSQKT